MKITKYAIVGRAPIFRAVGLQKNYKEVLYTKTSELDPHASGCFSCPNFSYRETSNADFRESFPESCSTCPNAVYRPIKKVKYISEKNIFGYSPLLSATAIKLFTLYHFFDPDNNGVVKELSIRELSKMLSCTTKTVKNCNRKLQQYDYISFCNSGKKGCINVCLSEYKNYSLTADKGGRGYATLSAKFITKLLEVKNIIELRIFLRTAIDMDTLRRPQQELVIKKPLNEIRRYLPKYCKPGVIQRSLHQVSALFSHVVTENSYIYFAMRPEMHGRRNYEEECSVNTEKIRHYITDLDKSISSYNKAIASGNRPSRKISKDITKAGLVKKINKFFANFNLSGGDFADLGLLCTTYSYDTVIHNLRHVYNLYIGSLKPIRIGAVMRSMLKSLSAYLELNNILSTSC